MGEYLVFVVLAHFLLGMPYILDVIIRQYTDTPPPFPRISIISFLPPLVLILVLVLFLSSFLPFLVLYYNN